MTKTTKQFFIATAMLVGSIIGVGIFGVPFAIAQIGVGWAIVYFIVLTVIQLLQHLFFAEVAIASPNKERLPALVSRHLGPHSKHFASLITLASYWAAMLAYIILGGTFLWIIFGPVFGGTVFVYQAVWAIVASLVIGFRLSTIADIDVVATGVLLVAFAIIIGRGLFGVDVENYSFSATGNLFLPYGVILFSLSGLPAILDMEDLLGHDKKSYRRAIITGTLLAAVITAIFGFVVYGVTGSATTADSVNGLGGVLGRWMTTVVAVTGFLAIATSYFPMGLNVREIFEYDYKMHRSWAWCSAAIVPVAFFFFTSTNFVSVISFSGAVFGAITTILIALMYREIVHVAKKKTDIVRVPDWVLAIMVLVLVVGALHQIVQSLRAWLFS